MAIRRVGLVVLIMVVGWNVLAAAPAQAARSADLVVSATSSCDSSTSVTTVTWRAFNSREHAPIVSRSLTPSGSTVQLFGDTTFANTNPVVAIQTVPLGTTSASLTITVLWDDGTEVTYSGTITFAVWCGKSKPSATFAYQCEQMSTTVSLANDSSALGVTTLTVWRTSSTVTRGVVGVYELPPGGRRTVHVPGPPDLVEVVQFDALTHSLWEYYANNQTLVNACPPVVGSGGGGGSGDGGTGGGSGGGGTGGGRTGVSTSATGAPVSPSTAPTPPTNSATSRGAAGPTVEPTPELALVNVDRSIGWLMAWAAVVVAVLGALVGAAFWVRRRSVNTAAPPAVDDPIPGD